MKDFFYYNEDDTGFSEGSVIKIRAKSKPSKPGMYNLIEFTNKEDWYFGKWDQVDFKILKKMKYLGSN